MPLIRKAQSSDDPAEIGPDPTSVEPGGPTRAIVDVTARIQQIIDAAERAAAEIHADAVAEAKAYAAERKGEADRLAAEAEANLAERKRQADALAAEAESHAAERKREADRLAAEAEAHAAERKREADRLAAEAEANLAERRREADALAAEYSRFLSDVADTLTAQIAPLEGQLSNAAEALRDAMEKIQSVGQMSEPHEPGERQGATVHSYEGTGIAADGADSRNGEPVLEVVGDSEAEAEELSVRAISPDPTPAPDSKREAALLRATQMAVSGSDREEIGEVLANEVGVDDAESILDQILGPRA
jgi:cell division septum initiation protein DivIVA